MKALIFIISALLISHAHAGQNCTASLYNKRTANLVEQQRISLFYDLPVNLKIGSIHAVATLIEVRASPDSFLDQIALEPKASTRLSDSNVLHSGKEYLRLDCKRNSSSFAVYSMKDKKVIDSSDLRNAYSQLGKEGVCIAGSMLALAMALDKAWYLPVASIERINASSLSFMEEIKETICERWEENSDIPPGVSCAEGYQERVASSRQITVNRCDLN